MPDPYQRGSDQDWAKAEAEELHYQLKRRDRHVNLLRMYNGLLWAALIWVLVKFLKRGGSFNDLLNW